MQSQLRGYCIYISYLSTGELAQGDAKWLNLKEKKF